MSKKSLYQIIFEQATVCLLAPPLFAFPKAQCFHGLNIPVSSIPMDLAVAWVISYEDWPNSRCRLLIFFFLWVITNWVISWLISQMNLILVTQLSWVLICQSLFQKLLKIIVPCKSSHANEDKFALALGQNFMGHKVCTHSIPSNWCTLMQSFCYMIVGIFLELPWIDSLISVTSKRAVS